MKFLKELLESGSVRSVGKVGAFGKIANTPDASRPTPVSALSHWGKHNAPLPDEFCQDRTWCEEENEEETQKYFLANIEDETVNNEDYRRVLFTARDLQLVLMSVEPGDELGFEVHENIDQFIRVEAGQGKVVVDGYTEEVSDGDAFIIPQGSEHNIINLSEEEPLKFYTIYSPPNHQKDVVHQTKREAKRDDETFDGDTDVQ